MDDKLSNEMDENGETSDTAEESGPLGRLLDHSIGSPTAESESDSQILNKPRQPLTAFADYAEGTHEHDDDRED